MENRVPFVSNTFSSAPLPSHLPARLSVSRANRRSLAIARVKSSSGKKRCQEPFLDNGRVTR